MISGGGWPMVTFVLGHSLGSHGRLEALHQSNAEGRGQTVKLHGQAAMLAAASNMA